MTSYDMQKRLSSNLKKFRKMQMLTQEELAEKANLSVQAIRDIEVCIRWPRIGTVIQIAEVFGIDPAALFSPDERGIDEIFKANKSFVARVMSAARTEIDAIFEKYC